MGRYGADAVLRRGVIRMGIYFDNAATTLKKPDCVINAVTEALKTLVIPAAGPMRLPWMRHALFMTRVCNLQRCFTQGTEADCIYLQFHRSSEYGNFRAVTRFRPCNNHGDGT